MIQHFGSCQHGVVARWQLERAGVPGHLISYRVKRGRLRRLYRSVYRTGASASRFEREMAAVMACGEAAVLSHRSAAALWGLVPEDSSSRVDVSVSKGCRDPGDGIRVHRMRNLREADVTRQHGIPITTVGRTLLDLAVQSDVIEVERMLAQAWRTRAATRDQVEAILASNPGRAGTQTLRLVLAKEEPMLIRSEAEKLALELFRKAGLPRPQSNVVVEGYEVDFTWLEPRLVAEIDGFAFHSSRSDFERDRLRDAALAAAGYRVTRITWRQLIREPEAVIARLAAALAR